MNRNHTKWVKIYYLAQNEKKNTSQVSCRWITCFYTFVTHDSWVNMINEGKNEKKITQFRRQTRTKNIRTLPFYIYLPYRHIDLRGMSIMTFALCLFEGWLSSEWSRYNAYRHELDREWKFLRTRVVVYPIWKDEVILSYYLTIWNI
jgi:hypothetical protein